MSASPILPSFEKVLPKWIARRQTALSRLMTRREALAEKAVAAVSAPVLQRMRTFDRDRKRRIDRLLELEGQLMREMEQRWVGISVKPSGVRFRIKAADLPTAARGGFVSA
ncbi:MAG: hypothetical protein IJF59_01210, partial [Clostridia bacterium]|nr:hypothetical protein [Clostridia bacterium]